MGHSIYIGMVLHDIENNLSSGQVEMRQKTRNYQDANATPSFARPKKYLSSHVKHKHMLISKLTTSDQK